MQNINHPNIVKIFGIFEESNKIFILLEFLDKGDFYEFVRLNTPLKYETAQFYTGQIVNTLEYLHAKGISHRDLKPENIMLNSHMHIKIVFIFLI